MSVVVLYSFTMGNDLDQIVGESRDIILSLTVAIFLISASKDSINNRVCYNTVKVFFIIVALAKILLLLFSIATGQNLGVLIESISKIWDLQMMTLGVDNSALGRIQIPIDSVVPYFLYFYTKEVFESKKSKMGLVFFAMICFSMLLTYSRLMWAQSIIFIGVSIVVEMKLQAKLKLFFSFFVIGLVVVYLTPLGDSISNVVSSRFGSGSQNLNDASDIVRIMQNQALWTSVQQTPLFGHGIGYYIPNALRSGGSTKYLYESQTLSMVMTLGYIGATAYVLLIVTILILFENKNTLPLGCLFFLFFWALSGSYNPYLFGASGGLIIYFCSQFKKINQIVMESSTTNVDGSAR